MHIQIRSSTCIYVYPYVRHKHKTKCVCFFSLFVINFTPNFQLYQRSGHFQAFNTRRGKDKHREMSAANKLKDASGGSQSGRANERRREEERK